MKTFTSQEIESYVNSLSDLQKSLVLSLREAVLEAGEEVKEGIKWSSIAFFHKKNICGFRVAKNHVTLLFMEGAQLEDPQGILKGDGAKARTYKVKPGDIINQAAVAGLVRECLAKGM